MNLSHDYYMKIALNQALKARGNTSPNPMVGSVLVKNNCIISRGFHKRAGLPHAEIEAIKKMKGKAEGSRLYVTLEPCCFWGKTPPCTDAIKAAGIKEVIIGMRDPNPKNNGRGIGILRKAGIKVKEGFLKDELKEINEVFVKYITKKMPFIAVKVGQSLDGKIATKTGNSKWITSELARNYARRLRHNFDAIMVGINTVISDNPKLEPARKKKRFFKIVVDPDLRLHLKARILSGRDKSIIVAAGLEASQFKVKRLEKMGVRVLKVASQGGMLNLKSFLQRVARLEITSILVEGGGTLIGSLFDQRLVDKIYFFIAPKIIGGREAISSVMGEGIKSLKNAVQLKSLQVRKIGKDYLFEGYVK
ncbi:MAG: bifunctional diaminohydroxyphosphoribosylaminopyrimidine deaminase/5-amino-6-(5-phosphoribosylamino)uracil reductase RibD [Candidatus Omnitrophota bacterium]